MKSEEKTQQKEERLWRRKRGKLKEKRRKAEILWIAVNAGKLGEMLWGTVKEKAGHTALLEVEEKQLSTTCCSS